MGAAREANPRRHLLQVSGVPIQGFGENTQFKFTRNAPFYKTKKGVDGEVTRSKVLDNSWTLEVTLMSSSQSNQVLWALALSEAYTFVNIEDLNGLTLFCGEQAWVEEPPPVERGAEASEQVWKIFVADAKGTITGT
jgi:hypothetical protein